MPFPLNSGKRLRSYNLFKQLASRHEIVWISRSLEGVASNSRALEKLGVRTIILNHPVRKKSGVGFYCALLANLFSSQPYVVSSHLSGQLTARVGKILEEEAFDLVHCEWTPYAANLIPFLHRPCVVMAHNVESVVWRRNREVERSRLKRYYLGLQWKKMERFERRLLPRFTRVIAVSHQDRNILTSWVSPERVAVVPNGVDTDYFRPVPGNAKPESLVFSGSLDWRPNVDSLLYFLDEIWPLIRAAFPGATMAAVGRNPSASLRARIEKQPSVMLRASVEDVRPHIKGAAVCVVPLRVGSGSRLKILEALAMEKAVVSTSVGAEGLDVEHEKDILIADHPRDFADAVVRLFRDPSYGRALGGAGRLLVEQRYTWGRLAGLLEDQWQKAVKAAANTN